MRILITCPPMIRSFDLVKEEFTKRGVEYLCPQITQTLAELELVTLVPQFDGWIIGDDPATKEVLAAGLQGRLRAAVKWGVGVDNVDFAACRELGLPIAHTPAMFGREVADIAMSYIVSLARQLFVIDRGVRVGSWPKPVGISLAGKRVALVGFGDIGRNVAKRCLVSEMEVVAYDPQWQPLVGYEAVQHAVWPEQIEKADFLVLACNLTKENFRLIDRDLLARCKPGVRIVNVSRGALVDEAVLAQALRSGRVHSAALEVFDPEPLASDSPLRGLDNCIFGSHNGSNTAEAVVRTSLRAIDLLFGFLAI